MDADSVGNLVQDAASQQGWITVVAAFGLYAGKRVFDVLLPRGYRLRFMDRWLRKDED